MREHADALGMPIFCGVNLRMSEIAAAMMREQLKRLDGIVADLLRVREAVLEAAGELPGAAPIPYHGGLRSGTGATIGYRFDDEETAATFRTALREAGQTVGIPLNSGKHVYRNWEPVLSRNGSYCERNNAFGHALNAESRVDYAPDMLPRTLKVLGTTVLMKVDPDWTEPDVAHAADSIRTAASQLS